MKVNGFEVKSNGMTYDDYKHMSNPYDYYVPSNAYLITNKRSKLCFIGFVDQENGTITVNDDDYNTLTEFNNKKKLSKFKFWFRSMCYEEE